MITRTRRLELLLCCALGMPACAVAQESGTGVVPSAPAAAHRDEKRRESGRQERKEFQESMRAESKGFQERMKAARAAFEEKQKGEREAFDAGLLEKPSEERKRLHREFMLRQKEERLAFTKEQREKRRAFREQQREKRQGFVSRNRR